MRPLETSIVICLALYLLWPHPRPLVARFLPALALLLTLIHFAVEGYRWQMVPLYILTALLGISALIMIRSPRDWTTLASILTLLLLILATLPPILLPIPNIARPHGQYAVGTTTFTLTDESRRELYSGRDEPRRFVVQVWYPATPRPEDKRAMWVSNAKVYTTAISKYLHLPSFFLDHLELVKTPAYTDAPIHGKDGGYPVIVFVHGWNGFSAQNTVQMVELASAGYIVVAVNHTYAAIASVFPDGEVAYNNPKALPDGAPEDEYEIAARKLGDQMAGDIAFTLDYLSARNDPAYDMNRIGVFGHSLGGGATVEFCGRDARCKAALGLDPFVRDVSQSVLERGLSQPAFFMFSEIWVNDKDSRNNQLFYPFYEKSTNGRGVVSISQTRHHDFTDLPMLSPISPLLGLKGSINGREMEDIMNAYILSFFDETLKGASPTAKDFPEVNIVR